MHIPNTYYIWTATDLPEFVEAPPIDDCVVALRGLGQGGNGRLWCWMLFWPVGGRGSGCCCWGGIFGQGGPISTVDCWGAMALFRLWFCRLPFMLWCICERKLACCRWCCWSWAWGCMWCRWCVCMWWWCGAMGMCTPTPEQWPPTPWGRRWLLGTSGRAKRNFSQNNLSPHCRKVFVFKYKRRSGSRSFWGTSPNTMTIRRRLLSRNTDWWADLNSNRHHSDFIKFSDKIMMVLLDVSMAWTMASDM